MAHALYDLVKHNAWATTELLAFCQGLDEQVLDATVPGTYGTISATFRHYIDSEMSYLYRLLDKESAYPWQRGEQVDLATLIARARHLATAWDTFLAGEVDDTRRITARGDDPAVYTVPAGVFITQAIHHGNEHRAHICTILGALGVEAPEVSSWAYAFSSGQAQV